MEAIWRRKEIVGIDLPQDKAIEERWSQFGVLTCGIGTYLFTHRVLHQKFFINRPVVPQFIAVVPAIAVVYVGGLLVRFNTLRRSGLLSKLEF